ncbi:DsbA family protein [Puia sp. P3]|uniref:DsbA family protein n=1 Tax=Puia sp. P3 TaxID=3423952 RepID=UPI003D668ECE
MQFLLVIAALNAMGAGLFRAQFDHPFELLVSAAVCFLLPALIWEFGKPFLFKMQRAKNIHRNYLRLKFSDEIFDTLLKKQMALTIPADGLGIDMGNSGAANTLIKICNPYCGPCSKAHQQIEELLEQHDNLRVKIIFTALNDDSDKGAIPARHLMALAGMGDRRLTKQALDDWYLAEKKDYTLFAAKYPLNGELAKQGVYLEAMSSWCKEMKVAQTPTIFYNGYRLPSAFNIDDIKYFLWE